MNEQRFGTSPTIAELAKALAKAQGEIGNAIKDSENEGFKRNGKASTYADLASVIDACRTPLSTAGIARHQGVFTTDDGKVGVRTTLMHTSGEFVWSEVCATPKDSSPQTLVALTTYLRRCSLSAAVCLAPEDDDGNEASGVDARAGRNGGEAPPPTRQPAPAAQLSPADELGVLVFKEMKWTQQQAGDWLLKNFKTRDPSRLNNAQLKDAFSMLYELRSETTSQGASQ